MKKNNQDLLLLNRFFGSIIDKEARRVRNHVERAREKGVPATLTLGQWLNNCERFKWRCAFCEGPFESVEHLVPVGRGGGTTAENCVPCCHECNRLHNKVLGRLERMIGRLRECV